MNLLVFTPLGVVPVLVGPLQALLALLPAILVGLGSVLLAMFRPAALKRGAKILWRQKITVLCAVAVVIGAVWGVRTIRAGLARGMVNAQETAAADWPMFRGHAERRSWVAPGGTAQAATDPVAGGVVWNFAGEARTFYASPAVVGNRIYVASVQKDPYRDHGAIYCLDADSGALVWKSAPDGFRATFSSPAVSGKYLVCGEGLHQTVDARIVCLDITRQGALLWQYRTRSHVESSPCIANGRVYVGAGDDGYYCLELEPAAGGTPQLVWHVEGTNYPDAECPPLVHDGRMYAGLGMNGNAVICLDAATGAQLWRIPTPYPVFATPTLSQGRIFVAMGNGNFVNSGEEARELELKRLRKEGKSAAELAEAEIRLAPGGEIWCMNPADGTVVWRFKTGDVVLGAIAARDDRIYFGARDGIFRALTMDGREVARWDVHAPILASPALAEKHAYVVNGAGQLYAFAEDRPGPVWALSLGSRGIFMSSPAVARGHVYVGTGEDGFVCVGKPAAREEVIWAGALGGPGMGGTVDGVGAPRGGQLVWRYPGEEDAKPPVITASAACVGTRLYVPLAAGARQGLAALELESGSGGPKEEWIFATPHGVAVSPAATERRVFVVDGRRGDPDRNLFCLAAAGSPDGSGGQTPLWRTPVSGDVSGELLVTREFLAIEAEPGVLACFNHDGRELWRRPVGRLRGAPAAREAILLAAIAEPSALTALDLPTGATLWAQPLSSPPLTGPVAREHAIYLGATNGVVAHSLLDGRVLWNVACGAPAGGLAVGGGRLAFVNSAGELVLLDVGTRGSPDAPAVPAPAVLWRRPGATPGAVPMLLADAVLCPTDGAIQRFAVADGASQVWMDTSWLGSLTSPPILSGGMMYFGIDGVGLVCAGAEAAAQ